MEIERKFLLNELPNIEPIIHIDIFQGYVSTNPEIRIRSYEVLSGNDVGRKDYKLTIKGTGDLSREEIEEYISKDFFEKIAQFIGKPLIHKDYRKYEIEGRIFECSIVDPGKPTEFCYGEVEFDTVDDANSYKLPLKGVVDVTYDKSYKMKNYWIRTRI